MACLIWYSSYATDDAYNTWTNNLMHASPKRSKIETKEYSMLDLRTTYHFGKNDGKKTAHGRALPMKQKEDAGIYRREISLCKRMQKYIDVKYICVRVFREEWGEEKLGTKGLPPCSYTIYSSLSHFSTFLSLFRIDVLYTRVDVWLFPPFVVM